MLLCTHLIDVDIYCIKIKDFKFYFFSINPDYRDLQSLQNYLTFEKFTFVNNYLTLQNYLQSKSTKNMAKFVKAKK